MLEKPEFDCNDLGAFYDCGCAEDEEEGKKEPNDQGEGKPPAENRAGGQDHGSDSHDHLAVEISKEE